MDARLLAKITNTHWRKDSVFNSGAGQNGFPQSENETLILIKNQLKMDKRPQLKI